MSDEYEYRIMFLEDGTWMRAAGFPNDTLAAAQAQVAEWLAEDKERGDHFTYRIERRRITEWEPVETEETT